MCGRREQDDAAPFARQPALRGANGNSGRADRARLPTRILKRRRTLPPRGDRRRERPRDEARCEQPDLLSVSGERTRQPAPPRRVPPRLPACGRPHGTRRNHGPAAVRLRPERAATAPHAAGCGPRPSHGARGTNLQARPQKAAAARCSEAPAAFSQDAPKRSDARRAPPRGRAPRARPSPAAPASRSFRAGGRARGRRRAAGGALAPNPASRGQGLCRPTRGA